MTRRMPTKGMTNDIGNDNDNGDDMEGNNNNNNNNNGSNTTIIKVSAGLNTKMLTWQSIKYKTKVLTVLFVHGQK